MGVLSVAAIVLALLVSTGPTTVAEPAKIRAGVDDAQQQDESSWSAAAAAAAAKQDDDSRQWLLDWLEATTGSRRRALNVRKNYFNAALSKKWLSCAAEHGHETALPALRLPRGARRVLFLGNSMVRQAAEATMMAVREEDVASLRFVYLTPEEKRQAARERGQTEEEFGRCPCSVVHRGGRYQYSCPVVDVLARADELTGGGAGKEENPKTLLCDSLMNSPSGGDFGGAFCSDDVAVMTLADGSVIAQATNAPVAVHQLPEFTRAVLGERLESFDAIIVNKGNQREWLHRTCGEFAYSQHEWNITVTLGRARRGVLDPSELVRVLSTLGFKGSVLYLGAYSWEKKVGIQDWKPALREVGIDGEYFPLRDKDLFPAMQDCGFAFTDSTHSVFPGPHILFPAYLRKTLARLASKKNAQ